MAAGKKAPSRAAVVDPDEQRERALRRVEALVATLARAAGPPAKALREEARALLPTLRGQRAWRALASLAEPLCRLDPEDHASRRLYAQALIETGAVTPALALVQALADSLARQHPEWPEAWGLVGRCQKQLFIDATRAGGKPPPHARRALELAMAAYARPYKADRLRHHWHGVNLLALASRAAREGWNDLVPTFDAPRLAERLMADLLALRRDADDLWLRASLAETALGRAVLSGQTAGVEPLLVDYVFAPGLQAFELASTLRQFTEVWHLDALHQRAAGSALRSAAGVAWAQRLLDLMRARLLQLPGGQLDLSPAQLAAAAGRPTAAPRTAHADGDGGQLEALLGQTQARPMSWWHGGMQAARSVALVRRRMGARLGSGFLVRAGDLGLTRQPDELLLLTNFHVVNREAEAPGIAPDAAEVLFESVDASRAHAVAALLWQSPVDRHDAALLRLASLPEGMQPLPLARGLPARPPAAMKDEDRPRVYVIGHPGGRELSISMADNALIDHEAPPEGTPRDPAVWRVHYRAPTEGGSSGSPVFEAEAWQVIALHHKGGKFGMPRLNGEPGTYAANEGLALQALAAAVRAELEPTATPP